MLKKFKLFIFIFFLNGLLPSFAQASYQVDSCNTSGISLGKYIFMLKEQEPLLDLEAIQNLPRENWQPFIAGYQSNLVSEVTWVKLAIENITQESCEFLINFGKPGIQKINFFTLTNGQLKSLETGAGLPVNNWALKERYPLLPLSLKPQETTQVYAQIFNQGQNLNLSVELWKGLDLHNKLIRIAISDGLVYGSMFIVVLLSLVLSWFYKRGILAAMALGVGFYILYTLVKDNYFLLYLYPNFPELNSYLLNLFVNLTAAAANFYLYWLVKVGEVNKTYGRYYLIIPILYTLNGLFGWLLLPLGWSTTIILSIGIVVRIILTGTLIRGLINKVYENSFPAIIVFLLWMQILMLLLPKFNNDDSLLILQRDMATTILVGGFLLVLTLITQVKKGRQAELQARHDLDIQNATEQQRLEKQVAERTDELKQVLNARRNMLAHISHDLRSPLANIVTSLRNWQLGQKDYDYPKLIESFAKQQLDMIDELLEFSRTELTKIAPLPVAGYLPSFLIELIEQTQLTAKTKGINLSYKLDTNLPAVIETDFSLLKKVLTNLLNNALKYTASNTTNGKVVLSVTVLNRDNEKLGLYIKVEDQASQLTKEEAQNLSQAFVRGANVGSSKGYGLGLVIVNQLLTALSSELVITNSQLGGNSFEFTLPVLLANEGQVLEEFYGFSYVDIDADDLDILLVTSQEKTRIELTDLLLGYGFNCFTAVNEQEAQELLVKQSFNLVITETKLNLADKNNLVVIYYAAKLPDEEDTSSYAAVLLKPIAEEKMITTIKDLM